ncbi:bifunctional histidinol-phosphatase/imidazoleglycerol-phosphate dehydratase HisB [Blochmannia endosymbiont of Camponotus (Colobopsis) obliquus]|uniref:bifunctional histidinol-phosphatase/imidazoleglycerol-phosphate dehydratase HisB n=1 Tax=Blochmannia endosymbiont of Camponotus (Colobopsis) obliquus TaxID=1505597 RepID=UPI00061A64B3|nr:bifunctional histidinol-phosphatase/imidazoleglycerol-phosphate dehydratase HisB [Blochmannia endosymbiont of Camponotus (Colobopsis) obliquus]AKC60617.1 histidine biosynthesis bifunctional protein hisB [Blochmannia endosymbiont of Camponotus (Colobopsis) obliquus]
MKQKILFIDRDGTLIHEPEETFKVDHIEKIILEPDVIPALLALQKHGFQLVMITNQDNLGTNTFPQEDFDKPHSFLMKIFTSQGIIFNKILICPHSLEDKCNCRKPQTTLITSWLNFNTFDKLNSYVIGDRQTDMMLAKNMDISGIYYHPIDCNWQKIVTKLTKRNRYAQVNRTSQETNINVQIWLDKVNNNYIDTGIKFFDHMLHQIATHANISMNIKAKGDLFIDNHHTVEDIGLTLGKALYQALNKKYGINRFGFTLPMDECLTQCVLDISGRPYLKYKVKYNHQHVGDLSTNMIEHFFRSLSCAMKCTLHIHSKNSTDDHHIAESLFKAFGRTLKQAIHISNDFHYDIPSTKGIL